MATATKTKAPQIPPTNESNKARRVREIIVYAIDDGRELTADEAAEINKAFAGDQVAAVIDVTKRFAADVAVGARLENFRPMLTRLLDGGAAGAIFDVAKHRHALQTAFEKTAWYGRKLDLLKHRDERQAEFEAARDDENTTPAKLKRLLAEYERSLKDIGTHLNNQDPTLVAFRREMEKTSQPEWNTLDWRFFKL